MVKWLRRTAIVIGWLALAVHLSPAATPKPATPPELTGWKPLPIEVRREVDAFFLNLELAVNYHQLDQVMALYTDDAVEEGADGSKLVFAGIRQRRQLEIDSYSQSSVKPLTVQRNFLVYKPGSTPEAFRVKYPVREFVKSMNGVPPPVDDVVYSFRRGKQGLQLSAVVAHASDGQAPPGNTPDLDGPVPSQIRLTNGSTLHQVKVLQWQPGSLLIQYVGGTVPIRMEHIHPDDRAYFAANLERMLQAQKEEAFRTAQAAANARQMSDNLEQMRSTTMARQAEVQEQEQGQIEAAISRHALIVGMSMDQVRKSWGSPSRVSRMDTASGPSTLWIYDDRGIDEHGNPANALVTFRGDTAYLLVNVKPR